MSTEGCSLKCRLVSRFAPDIILLSMQVEDEHPKKKKKVASCGYERQVPSPVNRHVPESTERAVSLVENECKVPSVAEEDLPPTPENEKEAIKQKFLVEMPEDFYSFWSFCKSLSPDKPEGILHFYYILYPSVNPESAYYKVSFN
jgi:hypothetical protein